MILTKKIHIFLYFTAIAWYNSATTDLIHEGGCLIDEKLSLSRVKIVQHGPLTLCFRQHIKYLLYYYLLYCYNLWWYVYNLWLYQCISKVETYRSIFRVLWNLCVVKGSTHVPKMSTFLVILTKMKPIFVYVTTNICYNSTKPYMINQRGHLTDKKNVGKAKWVKYGPLTVCLR